jgi:nucleotide-binding universal stress UspA family protein
MEPTYRMIVGVDGSTASDRALRWAVTEAARRIRTGQPCAVQAITAWRHAPEREPESVVVRPPDPRVAAERLLDKAVGAAVEEHPDVAVAAEVVEGVPEDVLVRAADRADLLVLGSHGHSDVYLAVVGSVTEGCIRNATCPVLVIPVAREASTNARRAAILAASPLDPRLPG